MRLTPDSSYPVIVLPEPVVVVQEVSTDRVTVLRVIEELIEPKVIVEFMVEGESLARTCVVLEGVNYFSDWDDFTITSAISDYLQTVG